MYSAGLRFLKFDWPSINERELPQVHQQHWHGVGDMERLGGVK